MIIRSFAQSSSNIVTPLGALGAYQTAKGFSRLAFVAGALDVNRRARLVIEGLWLARGLALVWRGLR